MWIRSPATCARSGATAADATAPGRSRPPWKGRASPRPGGASAASCVNRACGRVRAQTVRTARDAGRRGEAREPADPAGPTATPRTCIWLAILPMSASADRPLKKELVYRNHHTTIEQPRHDLNGYAWCSDDQRLHSTLGYRSPKEFTEQGLVL